MKGIRPYGGSVYVSRDPGGVGDLRADERHPPLRGQRVRFPVTPVGWEGFMAAEVSGHYGGASTYPVTPVGWATFYGRSLSGRYGAVRTDPVTPVGWEGLARADERHRPLRGVRFP